MPRSVPLRRSLVVRLLATSVLVAVCSIAATAWLAVKSTSRAIEQQQSQALSQDASIYSTLLDFAATHHNWDGVGPTVSALARSTGRRIALTTSARASIADSQPAGGPAPAATPTAAAPLPAQASAVVDPLNLDPSLALGSGASRIAPQATGPFQLSSKEQAELRDAADETVGCLEDLGLTAQISTSPAGRPSVVTNSGYAGLMMMDKCNAKPLLFPTRSEQTALDQLDALVNPCLARQGIPPVQVDLNFSWTGRPASSTKAAQSIATCIESGRREQLAPYVAPAALLFVTSPARTPGSVFDLSRANTIRIVEVTALVLAVTVAVTVLVATRLVRPLRALAEAAQRPNEPHARVPVRGRNEIGYLAAALNDLSQRRERIEQQREAMVSDVAHELRTPLSNIRGWLEAVQDGVAVPDPELVSALLQEALLLQHIIDDLRDLAAADADTFRLHPEPVRLREVLQQVAAAHQDAARAAGVTLETRTDGDPGLVADPLRLRQAVGNLVSNGIRHTPAGGSVTVGARRDGPEALIEVGDTGDGISPENLPHVFERFWRAEKSRSRQTGGSGLGLAIVRQLVQAHGGTVSVDSTVGKGSVFTLRLPAQKD
ncbi:ATP-binding protein [Streptacidiphilus sp. N1-10]|uniref:histidine kinase n=1 Tax=Streptacidiphilus jeojiensis TaxID=3229225 RepID=A0ABV6XGW9_9ACTN